MSRPAGQTRFIPKVSDRSIQKLSSPRDIGPVSFAGLDGRGKAQISMLETLYSPDAIQVGATSPGVPSPGPTWDARLRGLVTALETRVPGAAGHARRVAAQSRGLARGRGLAELQMRRIQCAAHVHDVGKIIVSPEILEKPGKLAPCEYEEVQRHAVFGARLVELLRDPRRNGDQRHQQVQRRG